MRFLYTTICRHIFPAACAFTQAPLTSTCRICTLQIIWEAVLGYAKAANVPQAGLAAALPVLATIAGRRLVQLPPGFRRLWGLPLRGFAPTQGTLEFTAAAIRSGQDSAVVDAASWQPDMLEWLRSATPAMPPKCMVDVLVAILKLPDEEQPATDRSTSGPAPQDCPGSSSDDAPSLGVLSAQGEGRWWQWWQEDAPLSAQLAGLAQGEHACDCTGRALNVKFVSTFHEFGFILMS